MASSPRMPASRPSAAEASAESWPASARGDETAKGLSGMGTGTVAHPPKICPARPSCASYGAMRRGPVCRSPPISAPSRPCRSSPACSRSARGPAPPTPRRAAARRPFVVERHRHARGRGVRHGPAVADHALRADEPLPRASPSTPGRCPSCGFRIHPGSVIDLECLCGGDVLCPIGIPDTCDQATQLLSSQTALVVCQQASDGRCVQVASDAGSAPSNPSAGEHLRQAVRDASARANPTASSSAVAEVSGQEGPAPSSASPRQVSASPRQAPTASDRRVGDAEHGLAGHRGVRACSRQRYVRRLPLGGETSGRAHRTARDALSTKAVEHARDQMSEVIAVLQSLSGVAKIIAVTVAVEVGQLSRFNRLKEADGLQRSGTDRRRRAEARRGGGRSPRRETVTCAGSWWKPCGRIESGQRCTPSSGCARVVIARTSQGLGESARSRREASRSRGSRSRSGRYPPTSSVIMSSANQRTGPKHRPIIACMPSPKTSA